jgi:hypothetical protein
VEMSLYSDGTALHGRKIFISLDHVCHIIKNWNHFKLAKA